MRALEAITLAIVLIAGLTLGWLAAGFYADLVSLPAARAAGRAEERVVHEEQRRRAEAAREAERQAAQTRIDAIERSFHERETARLAQLSALEAAIEQETSRAPTPPLADLGDPVCRPAVPRRLRDALAGIGAGAPRHDPAGAARALR